MTKKVTTSRFGAGLSPLPILLKVPEVAGYLGLSERTVWRKIDSGEIEVVRIGRSVRVPEPALRALIGRVR